MAKAPPNHAACALVDYLEQDGATAHTIHRVRDWSATKFGEKIINKHPLTIKKTRYLIPFLYWTIIPTFPPNSTLSIGDVRAQDMRKGIHFLISWQIFLFLFRGDQTLIRVGL